MALRQHLLFAAAAAAGISTAAGGLFAEEMQAVMQSTEDKTHQVSAEALHS